MAASAFLKAQLPVAMFHVRRCLSSLLTTVLLDCIGCLYSASFRYVPSCFPDTCASGLAFPMLEQCACLYSGPCYMPIQLIRQFTYPVLIVAIRDRVPGLRPNLVRDRLIAMQCIHDVRYPMCIYCLTWNLSGMPTTWNRYLRRSYPLITHMNSYIQSWIYNHLT